VESVLLVLGQVHVTAYFNQDEDIGEEDQVFIPFVKQGLSTYSLESSLLCKSAIELN